VNLLTQARLKELLEYDTDTGIFKWKIRRNTRISIGTKAGSLTSDGYISITLFYKRYQAHRLVWLYVYGEFPTNMIDHINGIKDDNRLCNLREATRSQNAFNTNKPSTNTSGYKGVCWHKGIKKWTATMRVNKKQIYIGAFDNMEDAVIAYQTASSIYHGEFLYQAAET
jgi:hypothetical protein